MLTMILVADGELDLQTGDYGHHPISYFLFIKFLVQHCAYARHVMSRRWRCPRRRMQEAVREPVWQEFSSSLITKFVQRTVRWFNLGSGDTTLVCYFRCGAVVDSEKH